MEDIAKGYKTFFRASLMDQKHGCEVAHALNITNVGSVVLEGTKNIDERLAQGVNFFK